ncbi:MAG: glycosyltransferase, partial [Halodesulfurarchaeum sp.]
MVTSLLDALRGGAFDLIAVVALLLGVVWTVVNFYSFYPLAQTAAERLARRVDRRLGRTAGPGASDRGSVDRGSVDRGTVSASVPESGPSGDGPGPSAEADEEGAEEQDGLGRAGEEPPDIDVLIPAYEEAGVVHQSIESVRQSRYPQEHLHVHVLLEPDDEETPAALDRLAERYAFERIVVPERYPGQQSKPRALDYGFEKTDGDIVGVVDAEDVVDPGLFGEVARGIYEEGNVAVQGRLDMVNEDDGWLNTIFRAEFGLWFGLVLPSFTEVGYPVPLGGTTCFFRRSALVATGVKREEQFGDPWEKADELWARREGLFGRRPWSTENVTEDFELGLFLWKDEQSVGYLDSTTSVESPVRLDNWVRQRTRWEKGKLYTLLQHRNGPDSGYLGRMHTTLQAGLPLLGPVNIFGVVFLFMIANAAGYDPGGWLGVLLSVGLAFVVFVSAFYGLGYWLASGKGFWTRLRRLVTVVVTAPVYWLLQWGAAIRAMWQVYNGLLHWERTDHNGRNGGGE